MKLFGVYLNEFKAIRFDAEVLDDYNIKATFDHDSPSDIDFYGHRETEYKVLSVESLVDGKWIGVNDENVNAFIEYYDGEITLAIQDAIDKQNGDEND